ncbi:MAG TPA: hydroxymethylbilane synthase [Longimicrobiales bacterium]|nr:hydroxymethylbilane synthase [Longimicrobiales bacterium]
MRRPAVRVGTRGSALSLRQSGWVAERLAAALADRSVELILMSTRGDRHRGSFEGLSERGLFTSELEEALLRGEIDVAVHSLKDLPVDAHEAPPRVSLPLVAVPRRADPRDAVVSRDGRTLAELPEGARVGTSSPRRAALVRAARPDARVLAVRGNVDTRVRRLDEGAAVGDDEGSLDALILAAAGLDRLGMGGRVSERLDPRAFPPAPGQGALAVQARDGDPELVAAVVALDDPEARATTAAERACLAALGGGCLLPLGAWARARPGGGLELDAFVGSADGAGILRAHAGGRAPEEVGRAAAEALLAQGARELLP